MKLHAAYSNRSSYWHQSGKCCRVVNIHYWVCYLHCQSPTGINFCYLKWLKGGGSFRSTFLSLDLKRSSSSILPCIIPYYTIITQVITSYRNKSPLPNSQQTAGREAGRWSPRSPAQSFGCHLWQQARRSSPKQSPKGTGKKSSGPSAPLFVE